MTNAAGHLTVTRTGHDMDHPLDRSLDRPLDQRPHTRPTCIIVEDDDAVRRVLTSIVGDHDVAPREFRAAREVAEACADAAPDIVFLDVSLRGFDAVDVLHALGAQHYGGAVQLLSGHHGLLSSLKSVGERNGLKMLAPLQKPFRASQIQQVLAGGDS